MREIKEKEMENLKTIINCKDEYSNEVYQKAINTLNERSDYLYPLITELAKKNISLKSISPDLYYEG